MPTRRTLALRDGTFHDMHMPGPPLSPASRAGLSEAPLPGGQAADLLARSLWRAVVVVASVVMLPAVGLAWLARPGLDLDVLPWGLAVLWFGTGVLLVRHGLRTGSHPHARFGAANGVTLLRLALASLLVGLIGQANWAPPWASPATAALAWGAVVLATATALLDACDGMLARRSGLASAFGARFDMETDAAFIVVLCAGVWQAGQAGPWVLAAGLMRYAFVAAAGVWPWLAAPLAPSRRRQTVCVVQITSLIVCLAPVVTPAFAAALAATSLGLLGLSFATDIRTLARKRHSTVET